MKDFFNRHFAFPNKQEWLQAFRAVMLLTMVILLPGELTYIGSHIWVANIPSYTKIDLTIYLVTFYIVDFYLYGAWLTKIQKKHPFIDPEIKP